MDFVDLANGLDQVTQTMLRHLTDAGDDDFARIDGEYHHDAVPQQTTMYQSTAVPQQQQQQQQAMPVGDYFSPEDLDAAPIGDHPFLSKSAEAELYLLATNFLLCKLYIYCLIFVHLLAFSAIVLCINFLFPPRSTFTIVPSLLPFLDVAMVIITTMVAKIYFPESLERGIAGMEQARTFNYRVAEGDDYYGSDDEGNGAETESSGAKTDDDNDDDNEILDSDPENDDDEEDGLLDEDEPQEEKADDLLFEMRPSRVKVSGKRRGVSFANKKFLEFEQMSLSKSEVMKRLSICVIMLNLTFVTWGVLQVCMHSLSVCEVGSPTVFNIFDSLN